MESKSYYWLTTCAQDQAVVPLHSCVQVYIKIQNENDNVPLTENAVYYPSVPESSPAGVKVLQLIAEDRDDDPLQRITYRITSGNPGWIIFYYIFVKRLFNLFYFFAFSEGFFAINTTSGESI